MCSGSVERIVDSGEVPLEVLLVLATLRHRQIPITALDLLRIEPLLLS